MNWMKEVLKRKDEIIAETQTFLKIKSVLDDATKEEGAPFGAGIKKALEHLLHKGEKDGFQTKNLEGYAGHIEMGEGHEIVGVLCHVDVVPEGDGWTFDPYGAVIQDGKLFARGALDDKGPTMAAYYAMKIVKELGLPLSKRVRMIIGTDEESDWRCVDHYFKHEEMPDIGFAPDADFPIIYAEKGIIDVVLKIDSVCENTEETYSLKTFSSGRRFNMVPDFAKAVIGKCADLSELQNSFKQFLQREHLNGRIYEQQSDVVIELEGISAHAMEPENGRNAGIYLAAFLSTLPLDQRGKGFVNWISRYFSGDMRGKKLNIAAQDEVSGELTVNAGIISYEREGEKTVGLNIRYPVTEKGANIQQKLAQLPDSELVRFSDSAPHYVQKDHPLIRTLQNVYEEQTGQKAELIAIGGGTYARSLKAGVAFGPLFPGRSDVAHQKDEYIYIDDLLKATAIYAQAIYELAK